MGHVRVLTIWPLNLLLVFRKLHPSWVEIQDRWSLSLASWPKNPVKIAGQEWWQCFVSTAKGAGGGTQRTVPVLAGAHRCSGRSSSVRAGLGVCARDTLGCGSNELTSCGRFPFSKPSSPSLPTVLLLSRKLLICLSQSAPVHQNLCVGQMAYLLFSAQTWFQMTVYYLNWTTYWIMVCTFYHHVINTIFQKRWQKIILTYEFPL